MRRHLLMAVAVALLTFSAPPTREQLATVLKTEVQPTVAGYLASAEVSSYAALFREALRPATQVADTSAGFALDHGCSLTAAQYDAVLAEYGSPAMGTGAASVEFCRRYGVDNAYVLAMFIQESAAGTAPGWAGRKPGGSSTANTGNVVCVEGSACYGRFADLGGDWRAGTELHFKLLGCYRKGGGPDCQGLWVGKQHQTLTEAVSTWAPTDDGNDPARYAANVQRMVTAWRNLNEGAQTTTEGKAALPWPGFLEDECAGLHSGARDYCSPEGTEVRAPFNGVFAGTGRYDDELRFGEYFIYVDYAGNEWYFGHLSGANPQGKLPGDEVAAGEVIGKLGPFAYSEPHLHLQLRRGGVLADPGPEIRSAQ